MQSAEDKDTIDRYATYHKQRLQEQTDLIAMLPSFPQEMLQQRFDSLLKVFYHDVRQTQVFLQAIGYDVEQDGLTDFGERLLAEADQTKRRIWMQSAVGLHTHYHGSMLGLLALDRHRTGGRPIPEVLETAVEIIFAVNDLTMFLQNMMADTRAAHLDNFLSFTAWLRIRLPARRDRAERMKAKEIFEQWDPDIRNSGDTILQQLLDHEAPDLYTRIQPDRTMLWEVLGPETLSLIFPELERKDLQFGLEAAADRSFLHRAKALKMELRECDMDVDEDGKRPDYTERYGKDSYSVRYAWEMARYVSTTPMQPRQREVIERLLRDGEIDPEAMGITDATLRVHIHNIRKILAASDLEEEP